MKHKWAKPAKFNSFVKKYRGTETPLLPDFIRPRDPVAVMVHSWLLWEASTDQAEVAMRKLLDAFVDFNEIRVSLPHEKATVIGKRYPRLEERLHGIRRTLHSLYLKRHSLSFDHLADKGKRDIRADIEELDGMHPFVAARILRMSFDVHALPADDQLSALLHENDVIEEPVDPDELSAWLGGMVKADDAIDVMVMLQAAVDDAWGRGIMTKMVRKHRPTRAPDPEPEMEIVEEVEPEPAPRPAAKKASAKKAPAKKTTKKAVVTKASAKKAPAKKAPAKKVARKAPAKKVATKAPVKKTAKKAATKAAAKKVAKKSPVKTAAKKTAKKTVKKAARDTRSRG